MSDERMLNKEQLSGEWAVVSAPKQSDAVQAAHGRIEDHIAAQAEQLKKANDTLVRLHDYGIDTRDFGDGDAQALWGRVDEFRADENATLSAEDVRELAEWWAELHESLCDLDDKYVAADEAREQAVADNAMLLLTLQHEATCTCGPRPADLNDINESPCGYCQAMAEKHPGRVQAERIAALEKVVNHLPRTRDGALYAEYEPKAGAHGLWCLWRYEEVEPWRVSKCHVPDRDEWDLSFDFVVEDTEGECEFLGPYSTSEAAEEALAALDQKGD